MTQPSSGGYLDAATAAPLHPAAREALLAALEQGWADPARRYTAGRTARLLRDGATEAVAAVVGARPDEVSFVAGDVLGTTLGVLGALRGRRRAGDVVVHGAVEHSAVLQACATAAPVEVGVDAVGRVDATPSPGGRARRGRARLPAERQRRGRHAAAGGRRRRCLPAARVPLLVTRRLRWAASRCRPAGRC